MKIALFINGDVGLKVADVFKKYSQSVDVLVVDHKASEKYKNEIKEKIKFTQFYDYDTFLKLVEKNDANLKTFDFGILCWWPYIVKKNLLDLSKIGFLNFHPSYLPYGRGKHPNFWTFVEESPFGVSLHWVDNSIDGGEIAFQEKISKNWEDTGATLYQKALDKIVGLFEKNFKNIIAGNIPRVPQPANFPVHYAAQLNPASKIQLDKSYLAKDLINLLRARTFEGYPACYFEEDGEKYEIRVEIKKVPNENT